MATPEEGGAAGAAALSPPLDLNERRRAQRMHVNLPGRYSSAVTDLTGWVSSISRTGLFLRSPYLEGTGTEAVVELELPDGGEAISVRGRVARASDNPLCPGMGIQFIDSSAAGITQVGDFMDRMQRILAGV